jgi:hypothetical protein
VVSVVEVVLEEGRQYARSRSIMSLPDRPVPPVQLFFLSTTVDIDPLDGKVPPILSVLSVPGVVPHPRGLFPLGLVGTPTGRNVWVRRPGTRNGLGRAGGLIILHKLGFSVLPVDLLVVCER